MARKLRVYSGRPTRSGRAGPQIRSVRGGPTMRRVRAPAMSRSSEQTQRSRYHR